MKYISIRLTVEAHRAMWLSWCNILARLFRIAGSVLSSLIRVIIS